jgi:hypothetical protein
MDFEYSALRRKIKIMEKFKTKEYLDELDRMGVNYTVDNNPSPEDIERIKKSIERRDERLKQMVGDYRSGKLKI